jgi:ABC-2 type transport system permease protein
VRGGDADQVARLAGAALARTPAVWVLEALALAAFGLALRLCPVAWIALAACVLVAILGPLLDLPGVVVGLSPFAHGPALPGGRLTAAPLVLTAVAAALAAVGLAALARRDVASGG